MFFQFGRVYKYFKRKQCFCRNSCLVCFHWIIRLFRSEESDPLETYRWRVYHAPYPEDIEWFGIFTIILIKIFENCKIFFLFRLDIALEHRTSWLWNIAMNALLLLIFLFLTTPAVVVKYFEETLSLQKNEQKNEGFVSFNTKNSILYISDKMCSLNV